MNTKFSPKKLTRLAGVAAGVYLASLAVSPKANALSLLFSDSDSFSNETTELQGNPRLTVNQYNPGVGTTVDQIVVTVTGVLESFGTVTNTATQAQSFTVTTIAEQFNLNPVAGAPTVLQTLNVFRPKGARFAGEIIATQDYTNLAPNTPQSFSFDPLTTEIAPYVGQSQTFVNAADIAQFLGTGTFSFDPTTTVFAGSSNGGANVDLSITTLASATLTVKYYGTEAPPTPVPFGFSSNMGIPAFTGVLFGLSMWKRQRRLKSVTIK